MVNINLVCQSILKEPLQARVSRGAVATVITACGFVTFGRGPLLNEEDILVATVITACGFVTLHQNLTDADLPVATVITACGFVTHGLFLRQ